MVVIVGVELYVKENLLPPPVLEPRTAQSVASCCTVVSIWMCVDVRQLTF